MIAVSVLAGLVIQYSPISPMKALFWSAVINGVVAVPLMVVIILLASKKSVMGAFTASRPLVVLGWIAAAVMGLAAVLMFVAGLRRTRMQAVRDVASVARMSEAISGVFMLSLHPAYRCADAGYLLTGIPGLSQ